MEKKNTEIRNMTVVYLLRNKWIILTSIVLSIAMMFSLKMNYEKGETVYVKEGEEIVGLVKENALQDITLKVEAEKNGEKVSRKVTFLGREISREGNEEAVEDVTRDNLDLVITKIVREANRNRAASIELPLEAEDGVKLSWSNPDSEGIWVLPALFPPLVIIFMFRGEGDKKRKALDLERQEIIKELPSFNNKLVLLLGSGLVYEEAIKRIGEPLVESKSGTLAPVLKSLMGEADKINGDTTDLLIKYAREKKITDLKRMLNIITDNRKRGTNLIPKLTMEGELLWEKRKKKAEEEGKTAESKLTMPLGIMLIALLIVTAGPALLQM